MISETAVLEAPVWTWQAHAFRAMNTDIHLSIAAPEQKGLARTVEDTFRYFEGLLSRFRPTSELSRLNNCEERVFVASPDFYAAVEAAVWAAQQTGGLYDPTILPYLEAAGYDRTFPAVPQPRPLQWGEQIAESAPALLDDNQRAIGADYRLIGLDALTQTIQRPPGLRIDLGGMGKGWIVDRVADSLHIKGHFLLNAGGDLYAYGSTDSGRGWEIHLAHPYRPELRFATLWLSHYAVATSTVAKRRWLKNGMLQHHLIDPRTGQPAQTDAVSVSVVGGRVFTAEVYAKVALILGAEDGLAFLEEVPDVEAAIFTENGAVKLTSGMVHMLDRLDPVGYPVGLDS